ncbi:gliding motility-associated C-terminal domain-containing protein [Cytophaga hutchinsonii]|nr:gliding motility-associated C-terminal domain-containing protein [Cytophaga hutchinsonii]SFX22788.1 gliding motility-associated C-terminal domain-containing protein [Cytophaga hutchinsonii ATCC 33406]
MKKIFLFVFVLCCMSFYSYADYVPCSFTVAFDKQDVRCHGEKSGSARVRVNIPSGIAYTIEWFDGITTDVHANLPAGTFFVKITDQTGCNANYFVTLAEPDPLAVTADVTDLRCYQTPEGKITLVVTGGTPTYSYQWSNGETSADVAGLAAGNYSVQVEDTKGCIASLSSMVKQPTQLLSSYEVKNVSCFGGSDGTIDLTAFGGFPFYTYTWDDGTQLQDVYNLKAGVHDVTIKDVNGCIKLTSIIVNQPDPITTEKVITDVKCYGFKDGIIDLTVSGGVMPYTFKWSTPEIVLGQTEEDLANIPVGTYYLLIRDFFQCEFYDTMNVKESFLLVTNLDISDAVCYDSSNASIDLTVTGGLPPYSYLWSSGQTTQDISAVHAGIYNVLIDDVNGCTALVQGEIKQPDNLTFGFSVSEVSCKDNDDGSIVMTNSGAVAPYSYSWSNGVDTKDLYDLLGNNYTITVTDAHACPFSATVTVPTNPRACITLITIPNAFSPNGDNTNDVWVIRDSDLYPDIKVKVINQWGETIFSSTGYQEPWDGTYKGHDVSGGTYYYEVNLHSGDDVPFSGTLTVIR